MFRIFLLFYFTYILFNQNVNPEKIPWSENKKLSFNDYSYNYFDSSKYGAMTYCSIEKEIQISNDTILIIVANYFYKNLSWFKIKDRDLLNHENIHFDIAEVYSRKIRAAFTKYNQLQMGTEDKIIASLDSIYNSYNDSLKMIQDIYDLETNLSRDSLKQMKWNMKIASQLKLLNRYKDSIVVKPLRFEN
jgi:hypothetical protein